jgi:hypothetical protein
VCVCVVCVCLCICVKLDSSSPSELQVSVIIVSIPTTPTTRNQGSPNCSLSQRKEGMPSWNICVPKTHVLKSSPQGDGVRKWGLWKVTRS